jgi:hypothetical protein
MGVRRAKAALSGGGKSHPAIAPAGSNRNSHGGTKWLKPSISVSRIGDSASVQAATRVNAEQSSKRTMRRSTRQPYRGRLIRLDEMSEAIRSDAAPGSGGGMYKRKAHETREAPRRGQRFERHKVPKSWSRTRSAWRQTIRVRRNKRIQTGVSCGGVTKDAQLSGDRR